MNEYPYPKWINPWAIKTPAGYSVYFKPPAHNPNQWFEILEGVVDTDTYSAPADSGAGPPALRLLPPLEPGQPAEIVLEASASFPLQAPDTRTRSFLLLKAELK